jgi:hypothetical protein
VSPRSELRPARVTDLRKEIRDPVFGRGELTWDDGVTARQMRVEVRNISNKGVQLLARTPIREGISAFLTGEEFRCMGTVRYCTDDLRGFLIGLEFSRDPHFKNAVAGEN